MKSGIYSGNVRHRRHGKGGNAFDYQLFMIYLDLAELDTVFPGSKLWSSSGPAVARFRREDYMPGDPDLQTAVRDTVEQETGVRPDGPIRLLTNLRYFGHLSNPISCYYCFNKDDTAVATIVAEVTNTPWGERTNYVLPCDPERAKQRIIFDKTMHVSPFLPMDMYYQWFSNTPGSKLTIHLENHRQGARVFDASLTLNRQEASAVNLRKNLWRFPWMTMKVTAGIYWQAARLYLIKRLPIYRHPAANTQRT